MSYTVSADEFERIAASALESIPARLRSLMDADNLMITIQPEATPDDRDNEIDEQVLGYYQGDVESVFSAYDYPKRIVLLQRHIENISASHEDLVEQVTETVLHEVAHYFGMDHDEMRDTRLQH